MLINKKQAGETIVEVLISILVISVALAGAFAISNRSQKTVQANQERYQAQILANSQADLLKNYLSTHQDSRPSSTVYSNGFYISPKDYQNLKNCNTIANCQVTADDSTIPYTVKITCNDTVCNSSDPYNTYKITVTWDSLISSGGQDNVELYYGS